MTYELVQTKKDISAVFHDSVCISNPWLVLDNLTSVISDRLHGTLHGKFHAGAF